MKGKIKARYCNHQENQEGSRDATEEVVQDSEGRNCHHGKEAARYTVVVVFDSDLEPCGGGFVATIRHAEISNPISRARGRKFLDSLQPGNLYAMYQQINKAPADENQRKGSGI